MMTLLEALRFIWIHRQLTFEMSKKDILERSHGQAFGYLWIFFHPLLLICVYSFVFIVVVRIRFPIAESTQDYGLFVLSGLIVWLGTAESLSRAASVLRSNTSLIKQVIFPTEVLPISSVLTSCFTQLVFISVYLPLSFFVSGRLPWTMVLLPLVFLIQFLGLVGFSLLISAISIYFKDIKEIVQAFVTVAVYTLPIFYTPDHVPAAMRWIVEWNPFTCLVLVYRDLLFLGEITHPWAWGAFFAGSLLLLATGYSFFRRVKVHFGSII